ncbi:class I SAM-dependent methyltransferase [Candidatus Sumerlaeota bacterium]|nr:class I SAM-dependent methyltransferase [Candidatus Sumerlaeota bacterium]
MNKAKKRRMKKYMQSCKTDFWKRVFQAEMEYLVQRLEGYRDVLSVGCGPAIVESGLRERGFNVTGLDVSREALNCAPDGIRTVVARAEEMPFPESSFDAAIYVASLQFIEDLREAIERTVRVLRPKGALIVMLLNPESIFFKGKMLDPNSYVRQIRHTDLKEIENAIADRFDVRTEYLLGVKGETVFDSRDRSEAVLYVVVGARKLA